jgi:hypothetical protein
LIMVCGQRGGQACQQDSSGTICVSMILASSKF